MSSRSKTLRVNTDVRFTAMLLGAGVIKERFPPKKEVFNGAVRGTTEWTPKDMLDTQGLYRSAIQLYGIEDLPVIVPNVRDAAGMLIHPSEYSQKITASVTVVVEARSGLLVLTRSVRTARVYQTAFRFMRLLPTAGVAWGLFNKPATKATDVKGKRKADRPAGQALPAKRGAGQSKAA
ncbi:hypothetical protein F4604DRAFT_1907997 [Suillus subluteus]|nr:hypothetical protein F4604DRAFT_1907997 [Suillus subluteus]